MSFTILRNQRPSPLCDETPRWMEMWICTVFFFFFFCQFKLNVALVDSRSLHKISLILPENFFEELLFYLVPFKKCLVTIISHIFCKLIGEKSLVCVCVWNGCYLILKYKIQSDLMEANRPEKKKRPIEIQEIWKLHYHNNMTSINHVFISVAKWKTLVHCIEHDRPLILWMKLRYQWFN